MVYLIMVLVAFIHVYFMIRIGYQSKVKDKKRIEKLMPTIMYSSLLAAVLTAFLWYFAPMTSTDNGLWIIKITIIFLPAYYFVGAVSVFIGTLIKKLLGK